MPPMDAQRTPARNVDSIVEHDDFSGSKNTSGMTRGSVTSTSMNTTGAPSNRTTNSQVSSTLATSRTPDSMTKPTSLQNNSSKPAVPKLVIPPDVYVLYDERGRQTARIENRKSNMNDNRDEDHDGPEPDHPVPRGYRKGKSLPPDQSKKGNAPGPNDQDSMGKGKEKVEQQPTGPPPPVAPSKPPPNNNDTKNDDSKNDDSKNDDSKNDDSKNDDSKNKDSKNKDSNNQNKMGGSNPNQGTPGSGFEKARLRMRDDRQMPSHVRETYKQLNPEIVWFTPTKPVNTWSISPSQ